MADGTPVDIVLNPLGVPITYEHWSDFGNSLRLGGQGLGMRIGAMSRAEAKASEVREFLDQIYNDSTGKKKTSSHSLTMRCLNWPKTLKRACHLQHQFLTVRLEADIRRNARFSFIQMILVLNNYIFDG